MKIFRTRVELRPTLGLAAFCGLSVWAAQLFIQADPINQWMRRLQTDDAPDRRLAVQELGGFGARAQRAIPVLILTLRNDKDALAREEAARALSRILEGEKGSAIRSPAIGALAMAMSDGNPLVRCASASALGVIGRGSNLALRVLISAMKDADAKVRVRATLALAQVGTRTREEKVLIIPELVQALKDPVPHVRVAAALGFVFYADEAPEVVPILVNAISDREPSVRGEALYALARFGPRARSAAPAVLAALHDPSASVREDAVAAVHFLQLDSDGAVPALVTALHDTNAPVRSSAARVLSDYGDKAQEALPSLNEAMHDGSRIVRQRSMDARNQIDTAVQHIQKRVPDLVAGLSADDPERRQQSAAALAAIGTLAAPAVVELIKAVQDREARVRRAAAQALGRIGAGAGTAIPALENAAAQDSDDQVRNEAASARQAIIGAMGAVTTRPLTQ
jgi:HEAT repeat protein